MKNIVVKEIFTLHHHYIANMYLKYGCCRYRNLRQHGALGRRHYCVMVSIHRNGDGGGKLAGIHKVRRRPQDLGLFTMPAEGKKGRKGGGVIIASWFQSIGKRGGRRHVIMSHVVVSMSAGQTKCSLLYYQSNPRGHRYCVMVSMLH